MTSTPDNLSIPPRILVVEDESIVAKDIQASLQALGYTIAGTAATGQGAIEQATALRPDLILMDVMLKGEMDGIEAAQRIATQLRIPVIFLTAYTDDDTLRRAKLSEAFGYLLKPFEDRELRTTIEMALYKHNMERKLRESHGWLETTLRCLGDAVLATDIQARIKLINPQAETLTGWPATEACQSRLADVFCFQPEDAAMRDKFDLEAILNGSLPAQNGCRGTLFSRGGRKIPVEINAAPIRESEGGIIGLVLVFRDITALLQAAARERELSERLAHARHLEALGVLAGGVAHDLNNILGPIVGYSNLIAKNLSGDNAMRADLEIIKNSARKAVDIIRDLLTLGRAGHMPTEEVNLHQVVETAMKTVLASALLDNLATVERTVHLAPDNIIVKGSAQHLQELVQNLLLHAYAMMPNGGRLQLATSCEHLTAPLDGYETIPPGDYAVLHVMDSGPALSEDELNRIFEPFFIKNKLKLPFGTGLGLAVVYGVIKEHNGFINIQSRANEGTDFSVFLPLPGASTAAPTAAQSGETLDFRGTETVLIVDDDEEQRRFASRWLRSLGYRVLTAETGRAAVALVAAEKAEERDVHLMVIDLIMADEIDGLETFRQALQHNPKQRAIIVSGFAITNRIQEAMKMGVGQYLQKPYTLDELARAVRRELDRPEHPQ